MLRWQRKQFLREYVKAIRDGNAAVFAGAGLSRQSGFVVWKELLRPLAEDICLNIDEEFDLTSVAQYVRNKSGNRAAINTAILEAYSKDVMKMKTCLFSHDFQFIHTGQPIMIILLRRDFEMPSVALM